MELKLTVTHQTMPATDLLPCSTASICKDGERTDICGSFYCLVDSMKTGLIRKKYVELEYNIYLSDRKSVH